MKKIIYILVFGLFIFNMNAQETTKYLELNMKLMPNEKVYLFGDNVKFRAGSNIDATVLSILKIGTELKVIEKVEQTYSYNGIDWPWYKVQYKGNDGYIIGGLISLEKKSINDTSYLISLKKIEDSYHIITRAINKNTDKYLENTTRFGTEYRFSLEVLDNKGIENISNMAFINYHAEACGVNGGGYYLFNNGKTLTRAIDLFEMSEAGIFNVKEEAIFPDEKNGKENKVFLKRTVVRYLDDEMNRTKTIIDTCGFIWKGKLIALKEVKE